MFVLNGPAAATSGAYVIDDEEIMAIVAGNGAAETPVAASVNVTTAPEASTESCSAQEGPSAAEPSYFLTDQGLEDALVGQSRPGHADDMDAMPVKSGTQQFVVVSALVLLVVSWKWKKFRAFIGYISTCEPVGPVPSLDAMLAQDDDLDAGTRAVNDVRSVLDTLPNTDEDVNQEVIDRLHVALQAAELAHVLHHSVVRRASQRLEQLTRASAQRQVAGAQAHLQQIDAVGSTWIQSQSSLLQNVQGTLLSLTDESDPAVVCERRQCLAALADAPTAQGSSSVLSELFPQRQPPQPLQVMLRESLAVSSRQGSLTRDVVLLTWDALRDRVNQQHEYIRWALTEQRCRVEAAATQASAATREAGMERRHRENLEVQHQRWEAEQRQRIESEHAALQRAAEEKRKTDVSNRKQALIRIVIAHFKLLAAVSAVSLLYHGFGVVTSTLHSACEVAAPTPSTFASIKRLWLPDPSVWLCNVYQASVPFLLSAFVAMNAILLAVAPWMIQLPVLSASLTGLVWLLAPHISFAVNNALQLLLVPLAVQSGFAWVCLRKLVLSAPTRDSTIVLFHGVWVAVTVVLGWYEAAWVFSV